MMLKGRKILSLPVVTSDAGKQIGEVKDIIYDPTQNKILGYLVEIGGWLRDGKGFLHSDLLRREDDCLVVENESVIRKIGSIPELKQVLDEKRDIRGLRVERDDGRHIGVIRDLVLDEETGEITGYEVSDGVIQDLLNGRTTIPNTGISIASDKVVTSMGVDYDTEMKGELR